METMCFNITCQFVSFFVVKERKRILPFVAIFSRHCRVIIFEYLSVRVVVTCRDLWGRNLITELQICTPTNSHVSAQPRSNDHIDVKRLQYKNVFTGKRWRI